MLHLVMLLIPCAGVVFLIAKLPPKAKETFYKIPPPISALGFSLIIRYTVHGVMAGYAAIVCDMVLWPVINFMRAKYLKKKELTEKKVKIYRPNEVPAKIIQMA